MPTPQRKRKMANLGGSAIVFLAMFSTWNLEASDILYAITAKATGTLSTTFFTNATIEFLSLADPNTVKFFPNYSRGLFNGPLYLNTGATLFAVDISGSFYGGVFKDAMSVVDFQNTQLGIAPVAGILDDGNGSVVLGTFNQYFATYNLSTPTFGRGVEGEALFDPSASFSTTRGTLTISSVAPFPGRCESATGCSSDFSAVNIPEPTAVVLLGTVLGILTYGRWRNRRLRDGVQIRRC